MVWFGLVVVFVFNYGKLWKNQVWKAMVPRFEFLWSLILFDTVDGSEIRRSPPGMYKTS